MALTWRIVEPGKQVCVEYPEFAVEYRPKGILPWSSIDQRGKALPAASLLGAQKTCERQINDLLQVGLLG